MYVDVRELPKCVKEVLRKIGFNKKEIPFDTAERVTLRHLVSLPYNRGFSIIINLSNGKYRVGIGSYGGTNQFHTTIVDDCNYKFRLPSNFILIKGEHGSNGSFATMTMRPGGALPFVGSEDDCEDRMYKLLKIFFKTSGNRRIELLGEIKPLDIKDAIKLNFLAYVGSMTTGNLKITKRGKKYIRKYEELFPGKKIL
jgi:hypothetical protein